MIGNDSQTEENFYDSIIIAKTVGNVTLEFLRYGTEIKMGIFLQYEVATHNKQKWKLLCVSLFQIFSAMFLPNVIWIALQLRKLSQKYKGWTFYWDTVLWFGGIIISTLDLQLKGCGFSCWPLHFHVTMLGKLFTPCTFVTKQYNLVLAKGAGSYLLSEFYFWNASAFWNL